MEAPFKQSFNMILFSLMTTYTAEFESRLISNRNVVAKIGKNTLIPKDSSIKETRTEEFINCVSQGYFS